MNLIAECLHMIFHRQVCLKGVLVLGREDDHRDLDMLGVLGINHGGMNFSSDGERRSFPR